MYHVPRNYYLELSLVQRNYMGFNYNIILGLTIDLRMVKTLADITSEIPRSLVSLNQPLSSKVNNITILHVVIQKITPPFHQPFITDT